MFKLSYASSNLSKKKPPSAPSATPVGARPSPSSKLKKSGVASSSVSVSSTFSRPTAASLARQQTNISNNNNSLSTANDVSRSTILSTATNIYTDPSSDMDDNIDDAATSTSKTSTTNLSKNSSITANSSFQKKPKSQFHTSTKNNKNGQSSVDVSTIGSISTINSSRSSVKTVTSSSATIKKRNTSMMKEKPSHLVSSNASQSPRRDPPPTPIPASKKISPRRRGGGDREGHNHQRNVHFGDVSTATTENGTLLSKQHAEEESSNDPLLQVAITIYKRNILDRIISKSGIHRANRYADLLHLRHQRTTTRLQCFRKWRERVVTHRLQTCVQNERQNILFSCLSKWRDRTFREVNCRFLQTHLQTRKETNLPLNCFLKWRNEMYTRRKRPQTKVLFDKWKNKALNRVMVTRLVESLQQKCWNRWKERMVKRQKEVFAAQVHRRVVLMQTLSRWKHRFDSLITDRAEELLKDHYWRRKCFVKWRTKYRDRLLDRKIRYSILQEEKLAAAADDDDDEDEEESDGDDDDDSFG